MIIKKQNLKIETKKNARGGDGEIEILHLINPEELTHGRLFAKLTIPPGASFGLHEHQKEVEYFVILKGNGIIYDNGQNIQVAAGDVTVTKDNESHSIRNNGSTDLELIALIITD